MGTVGTDWANAWTLEKYITDLFEKKQTDSPEFKSLLRVYGKEKLAEMWKRYRESKVQSSSVSRGPEHPGKSAGGY